MALVAGCRPQMVLFAALALPILWPRYITEKRLCTRRGAGEAAAFILPVVLVAVGLCGTTPRGSARRLTLVPTTT